MNRIVIIFLCSLIMLVSTDLLLGQRFSLLLEGGAMRTQIHGDKLTGYDKFGYTTGIGTNYLLDNSNFISVKTLFYEQGSIRNSVDNEKLGQGVQMALNMNSIGVEFSYKYAPAGKSTFMGAGVLMHRIIAYSHDISYRFRGSEIIAFGDDQINSTFASVKFFSGYTFLERMEVYLAFEGGVTNMLRADYYDMKVMRPYSLSLHYYVDIISSKKIKVKKKRPRSRR